MRSLPSHLKVPWGIGSALVVYLSAWVGSTILLVVLLRLVAVYSAEAQTYLQALSTGDIYASFSLTIINALIALGLEAWYLKRFNLSWNAVGWRGFNLWQAALYLLGIFIFFAVAVNALLWILPLIVPGFNSQQPQVNEFTSSTVSNPTLALIALVIIPPIIEETVFRGFIFPAFAQKWGTVWGAIISSLLFGFAHLQLNISVYTFVLGLLLCFLYVRLKSIFPGMLFHMLNNYLAFIAITGK